MYGGNSTDILHGRHLLSAASEELLQQLSEMLEHTEQNALPQQGTTVSRERGYQEATQRRIGAAAASSAQVSQQSLPDVSDDAKRTHHISPAVEVVIIAPVQPSKLPWLCQLARSADLHSEIAILPIFADESTVADYYSAYGEHSLQPNGYMTVPPGKSKRPLVVTRYVAIWRVFNETQAQWAIAADVDMMVQPRVLANATSFLQSWEKQRAVIASNLTGNALQESKSDAKQAKMDLACAALGLPAIAGFPWWGDAPAYSRYDFDPFIGKLRQWRDFMDPDFKGSMPWDHLTYLCYKIRIERWSVRYVDYPVEDLSCAEEQTLVPGHRFIWSRDTCSRTLLAFNLATGGKLSFMQGRGIGHVTIPPKIARCFEGWNEASDNGFTRARTAPLSPPRRVPDPTGLHMATAAPSAPHVAVCFSGFLRAGSLSRDINSIFAPAHFDAFVVAPASRFEEDSEPNVDGNHVCTGLKARGFETCTAHLVPYAPRTFFNATSKRCLIERGTYDHHTFPLRIASAFFSLSRCITVIRQPTTKHVSSALTAHLPQQANVPMAHSRKRTRYDWIVLTRLDVLDLFSRTPPRFDPTLKPAGGVMRTIHDSMRLSASPVLAPGAGAAWWAELGARADIIAERGKGRQRIEDRLMLGKGWAMLGFETLYDHYTLSRNSREQHWPETILYAFIVSSLLGGNRTRLETVASAGQFASGLHGFHGYAPKLQRPMFDMAIAQANASTEELARMVVRHASHRIAALRCHEWLVAHVNTSREGRAVLQHLLPFTDSRTAFRIG